MKGIAIIAAAGRGSRAGVDKIRMTIEDETVLTKCVRPFISCAAVDAVIVVVRADAIEATGALLSSFDGKPIYVIAGGETRTESVRNALLYVEKTFGTENVVVAIQDGARPFVTEALIERCMLGAAKAGSAVPVVPCSDSIRKIEDGGSRAVDRREYVLVQTPQCFDLVRLLAAYKGAEEATDDATLYEKKYGCVSLVEGDVGNRKITYLSDNYGDNYNRVGVGYDVHELVVGRPLILGGVNIPHDKGLLGHSDADVLTHAVMDAVLTAADLPDIGHFFPPDDPAYEGADSLVLLETVRDAVRKKGYAVVNVSATIMAEKPKLARYLPEMERKIASVLGINETEVRFAATTTEKLGIVGEERGMASEAVALLAKRG